MHEALTALLRAHACELGLAPPVRIPVRPVRRDAPGDWSSALAHVLATPAQGAAAIAHALADRLRADPDLASARADGGYLTLTLSAPALAGGVCRLLAHRPGSIGAQPGRPGSHRAPGGWWAGLEPVAFAHARSRNVARAARAHGVAPTAGDETEAVLTAVVDDETTRHLMVYLGAFAPAPPAGPGHGSPERAADPDEAGVGVLLRELATRYQEFYAHTRTAPRGPEPVTSTHRTHLILTEATSVALAAGLSTLGLPAPEHL